MKVLICDDQTTQFQAIESAIDAAGQSDVEIKKLIDADLTNALKAFFGSVNVALEPQTVSPSIVSGPFEGVDIVIVDNNLAHLTLEGARLTAESIVGYLRAFTATPYFISLNRNPDVDFDLRYLVGDYSTSADLALNIDHLKNPALWTGRVADAAKGFLPWYWPALKSISQRRRSQIEFVNKRFDQSVFAATEIPTSDVEGFLSLHAKGALSPDADSLSGEGTPIDKITFRDVFVASGRSITAKKDRERMSAAGTAQGSAFWNAMSRVVAAEIDLWFRRDVVGPQEALVDVPHLIERMPFLLGSAASKLDGWNAAVESVAAPYGLDPSLFSKHLEPTLFKHEIWSARPSFWWSRLKADDSLNQLFFNQGQGEWLDGVFCEDRSLFLQRSGTPSPTEFSAEFEGSWGRRYVAKIQGVKYAPRSRFAV